MSPRRSKEQIIIQILTTSLGNGISKTQIISRVKMDYNYADLYLDLLIKKGLLEVIQGKFALYKTTSKGENVLESLRAIVESCS
jgi:predicted transcriptional regulator